MDNITFFKYLWRFNALAIALLLILLLPVSYVVFKDAFPLTGTQRPSGTVLQTPSEQPATRIIFLPFQPVSGTHFMQAAAQEISASSEFASKHYSSEYNNLFFINKYSGEGSWLLPTHKQLFFNSIPLYKTLNSTTSKESIAQVYHLADTDTNADGILSRNDTHTIATSNFDGTGYKKLLANIDRLYSMEQTADDRLTILYRVKNDNRLTTFSVPDLKLLTEYSIPPLK